MVCTRPPRLTTAPTVFHYATAESFSNATRDEKNAKQKVVLTNRDLYNDRYESEFPKYVYE